MKYDYKAVEAKWQKVWEDEKTFHVEIDHKKPKFYALVEFPYPSGAGLHVGHPRSYTALDVVSRKRRQNGYNVLYPMGWDAFGLPTENFAMKNHIHPAIVTKKNVDHFREQLKALGFSFDWDREINTTDPEYYKWTQWIFLQLYKHGLAYKKEMNVNWCTGCKCVLANEEVVNGVCERCGSEVVHKVKSQWMLKITAYADKLIDGLDGLDYIERVSTQQKNWIGRSHGAEVNFGTTAGDTLTVYTTRCDTLFGATYMVVSPEHAMVKEWLEKGLLKNADAVTAYQAEAARKSDFERSELNKEKTGVRLEGVMGINPVNDKQIPIFISDYVLSTYGTGAIMAVPAHDHVVTRRLFGQHAVFLRPDMGQGDQRVALVAQRLPVGHGIHRVREGQPREILVVPRRMVVVVVVGHRGHEADPAAAPLDDRIGRRLGKGRRIAYDIGADDRKPALRGAHAQKSLSGVELVVAEGRHVVTQAVHQIDDRPARLGGSIAVDVARPAVARIDQNHVLHRIAALLDGFGQLRELLDMGVDVVGRKNHHRLHARRASRQHEEQQCAK